LDASDWCTTFEIKINDPQGVLIERVIEKLKEEGEDYDIEDIIKETKDDERTPQSIKDSVENRFLSAKKWGIFDKEGTPFNKLVAGGQVTILDVSCYTTIPGATGIRALVIGLVAEKLFIQRMIQRKKEEYSSIRSATHFLGDKEVEGSQEEPWFG